MRLASNGMTALIFGRQKSIKVQDRALAQQTGKKRKGFNNMVKHAVFSPAKGGKIDQLNRDRQATLCLDGVLKTHN